jgi:hypothetical protein
MATECFVKERTHAARQGYTETESSLVRFLSRFNQMDRQEKAGRSPLRVRRRRRVGAPLDVTRARILYNKGAKLNVIDNDGNNAIVVNDAHHLMLFCDWIKSLTICDYEETFSLFLKECLTLLHQRNRRGQSPMLVAVQKTAFWAVHILLDKGATITDTDEYGNSVLHYLTLVIVAEWSVKHSEKFFQYLEKFLSLGININITNKSRREYPVLIFPSRSMESEDEAMVKGTFEKMLEAGADSAAISLNDQNLLHLVVILTRAKVSIMALLCCAHLRN